MIEVQNLTKRYGAVPAVDNISFTAHPGQVTGFLGPNGAGKTTTMRMLTGYMPPTSGRALVAGYDVFEQSLEVRRRVGYLPENVPLYRDMTALGYLMYIGEIRGIPNRRDKAYEVLEQVKLADRANSRIRTLSKGMRQRVGLAQALLHDPEVLILDEPTIGLDPLQVLELRELVRELGKNHTVLFSTHILSEAEQVCDSVVIIHRGTIVAQGSPSELRSTLERGGRVFVRTNAPAETALPRLQQLAQVAQVEAGLDGIIITPADPNADPRPAIARAVLENGWDLIELRPLAVNLEEIFLELTRAPEAAAEAEPTPESEVVA
ncbi:MAG: multidrug ABC transporter ATP-binding protein [Chloroflexota bacterium]|nr:MAG: multidrug ABC transporter ATP-binding protein [Chloroflexota bacterium]